MNKNSKRHVAVNFDLSVRACREHFGGSRSKAYSVLKKDLTAHGFIHDQGSGYVSEKPLSQIEITVVMIGVFTRQPWLEQCCKKLRITQIEKSIFNDMTHAELIASLSNAAQQPSISTIPTISPKTTQDLQFEHELAERRQAHLAEVEAMDISPERKAELQRGIDEIYSRKSPTIAEIKAELRGKSPSEIAEMSRQARQKNKQNGNNSNGNDGKPPNGNGSGGNSGR